MVKDELGVDSNGDTIKPSNVIFLSKKLGTSLFYVEFIRKF